MFQNLLVEEIKQLRKEKSVLILENTELKNTIKLLRKNTEDFIEEIEDITDTSNFTEQFKNEMYEIHKKFTNDLQNMISIFVSSYILIFIILFITIILFISIEQPFRSYFLKKFNLLIE